MYINIFSVPLHEDVRIDEAMCCRYHLQRLFSVKWCESLTMLGLGTKLSWPISRY